MDAAITLADLGLELPSSGRGRRPTAITAVYSRDLQVSDVALLLSGESIDVKTPSISQLKHTHHQLARLIAEGSTNAECSLITGYSPSRISILKQDPAFAELIAYYSEMQREIYVNVHERLAAAALDALEVMQERLSAAPEKISFKELMSFAELTLDRSGSGPHSTVKHEGSVATTQILIQVRNEIEARRSGRVKELDLSATPNTPQGDLELDLGAQAGGTPPANTEGKVIRLEGQRQGVRAGGGEAPQEGGV